MSTLKTNNIQHVDRSEPSIIINTDGSVSIAGTVSYEDSTNVDSVGVVTARKQLHVGTGVSIAAGGLNVTSGISTFVDVSARNITGVAATFSHTHIDMADSIRHIGDTNTKIRFPAANTFTVETAGSERVRVTSSGVVGINTVGARGATLEIQDIGSTGPTLLLAGATDTEGDLAIPDGQDFNIGHWNNVDTFTERFHITSAGKIGIGIANPDELLHIFSSSSNSKIVLEADNNSAENGLFWVDEGDSTQSEFYYDHAGNKHHLKVNGNGFEIYSKQTNSTIVQVGHGNGYNDLVVPNGEVGIGTGNPASDLHILDTLPRIILEDSDSGRYLTRWWQSGNATVFDIDSEDTGGSPYFMFKSGGIERLRITDSGLVGIGTDSPAQPLHISRGSAVARIQSTDASNSARLEIIGANDSYSGLHLGDVDDVDVGRIRYYHGGSYPNSMRFTTGATDHMMIHSGGVVSFNSGIELGSGLDATAANTLDDYEEGTWSPILADNSGNTSTFGGVTSATYTKIGNSVRLSLRAVNMQTTGLTSSDPLYVKGLPFDTVGYSYGACWLRTFLNGNWGADKCMVFGYFESNKAFFQGDNGATGGLTLTVNDVSHNNSDLFFTVVYTTNA